MIPKYNNPNTRANSNVPGNNQDKKDKKILTSLKGLRHITFENGNLLFENESYWYYLGFAFIILGGGLFFDDKMNVFLRILLAIGSIMLGFSFFKLIESYLIINTTMNTVYHEVRFSSFVIHKSKSINLKDIVLLGVDHKRISPKPDLPDPKEYDFLSFIFGLIAATITGYFFYKKEKKKDSSFIDGKVEGSAIAYLTSDGKINYFNSFSDKVNAEDNNIKLAEALGLYTNLPVTIAKKNECLEVTRMGSKFKFTSKNIKPTVGGTFLKTLAFALLGIFLVVLFFILLIKFI